ncbi:hypothetical protein G6F52_009279 [Rhizopus delemar]|nr:hypothetical protein G6F52_009279 [Rhizopus delemar]
MRTTKEQKLAAYIGEQQQKSSNSSLPSNQVDYQQKKPTNFWMKRWKVPSDLQSMPGALRLPPSLKHLEAKESGSKREAFSEEFIARYNEVNYQQRILKAEITSTSAGRGRGGRGSYGRGGTKNYFGGGDVGPQPSTTTVIPIIITIQHQQTIQHRELPVSNGTQITTLTAAISINTTDSTTINTIEPYYNLNNELHHPLRWHCTGQSPITFSPLLENNNQSSLTPISNSKWLQDPTFQETDPMEESKEGEDSRRSIILSAKQYRNSWMEGR